MGEGFLRAAAIAVLIGLAAAVPAAAQPETGQHRFGDDVYAGGMEVRVAGTGIEDVYAAGEVAFHYSAYYDAHRREETWQHAVNHGTHVAHCMLGGNDTYAQPMSYWTDQYDYSVQVFGTPQGIQDVMRGDPLSGGFSLFHLDESGICGMTAVNAARELRKGKSLVLANAFVPAEVIQNTDLDLSRHVIAKAQN